jgi:hypothetical protein
MTNDEWQMTNWVAAWLGFGLRRRGFFVGRAGCWRVGGRVIMRAEELYGLRDIS